MVIYLVSFIYLIKRILCGLIIINIIYKEGGLKFWGGGGGVIKDYFFKEMYEVKFNLVLLELMEGLKVKKFFLWEYGFFAKLYLIIIFFLFVYK